MRRAPVLVGALGWVLMAAGITAFWLANRPGEAGWTAYTGSYEPLQPGGSSAYESVLLLSDGWTVLWTGTTLLGAALLVLGLVVLAGLAGWLIGRRAGRPSDL